MNIKTLLANVLLLAIFAVTAAASGLPSDYTRLEYIASTGTQYVTSGIIADTKTGVDFRFRSGHEFGTAIYFGLAWGNYNYSFGHAAELFRFYGYGSAGDAGFVDDADCRLVIDPTAANNYVLTCGDQTLKEGTVNLAGKSSAMRIFSGTTAGSGGSFWFYEMSITTNNGVLARHFIPVRREIDGAICLYDLEDEQFYLNEGTGIFVSGPVAPYAQYGIAPIADQAFDGTEFPEPLLTVTNATTGATLAAGTDYEVVYSNNHGAGVATAYVTGKGAYAGQWAKADFAIVCTSFNDGVLSTDDTSCLKYVDGDAVAYVFTNIAAAANATVLQRRLLDQVLVVAGGGAGGGRRDRADEQSGDQHLLHDGQRRRGTGHVRPHFVR